MTNADPLAQRRAALERANHVRVQRSVMKGLIFSAEDTSESRERAITVLMDPPWYAESMTVAELLGACWRSGPRVAARILDRARIGERKPLGDLTMRQRLELAALLRRNGQPTSIWERAA